MVLSIPDIAKAECLLFRACGRLASKDKEALAIIRENKKKSWRRAPVNESVPLFVLVSFGGSTPKLSGHVHIDVVRKDFFSKKPPGKPAKLSEIENVVAQLYGQEFAFDLEGHFVIDKEDFAGLVRETKYEMRSPGFSLTTKSASLSVKGPPIYRISWFEHDEHVSVIIEARTRLTMNAECLSDGFKVLDSALKKLVLGDSNE